MYKFICTVYGTHRNLQMALTAWDAQEAARTAARAGCIKKIAKEGLITVDVFDADLAFYPRQYRVRVERSFVATDCKEVALDG